MAPWCWEFTIRVQPPWLRAVPGHRRTWIFGPSPRRTSAVVKHCWQWWQCWLRLINDYHVWLASTLENIQKQISSSYQFRYHRYQEPLALVNKHRWLINTTLPLVVVNIRAAAPRCSNNRGIPTPFELFGLWLTNGDGPFIGWWVMVRFNITQT